MTYAWCKCGEYVSTEGPHKCPPQWDVWCPDNCEGREDGLTVYACDAEEAAEKYAEECDSYGDYTIVGGAPVTVVVSPLGDEHTVKVFVEGESVPSYTGRVVEGPK
jgi:hypothetical protein